MATKKLKSNFRLRVTKSAENIDKGVNKKVGKSWKKKCWAEDTVTG